MECPTHDHKPTQAGGQIRIATDRQREAGEGAGDQTHQVARMILAQLDPGIVGATM
jgi:hypothetical protein